MIRSSTAAGLQKAVAAQSAEKSRVHASWADRFRTRATDKTRRSVSLSVREMLFCDLLIEGIDYYISIPAGFL